jgi:hypothetical protein
MYEAIRKRTAEVKKEANLTKDLYLNKLLKQKSAGEPLEPPPVQGRDLEQDNRAFRKMYTNITNDVTVKDATLSQSTPVEYFGARLKLGPLSPTEEGLVRDLFESDKMSPETYNAIMTRHNQMKADGIVRTALGKNTDVQTAMDQFRVEVSKGIKNANGDVVIRPEPKNKKSNEWIMWNVRKTELENRLINMANEQMKGGQKLNGITLYKDFREQLSSVPPVPEGGDLGDIMGELSGTEDAYDSTLIYQEF